MINIKQLDHLMSAGAQLALSFTQEALSSPSASSMNSLPPYPLHALLRCLHLSGPDSLLSSSALGFFLLSLVEFKDPEMLPAADRLPHPLAHDDLPIKMLMPMRNFLSKVFELYL